MQSNNMKHIKSSHIVRQKIIFHYQCFSCERPSGLKFSVLDSGSRGLGSRSMGQGQRVKVNGSRSTGQGQWVKVNMTSPWTKQNLLSPPSSINGYWQIVKDS